VRELFRQVPGQRSDFPALSGRYGPGLLTVLHMVGATDLPDYEQRAREWATRVWESCSGEHERVHVALRAARQDTVTPSRGRASLTAKHLPDPSTWSPFASPRAIQTSLRRAMRGARDLRDCVSAGRGPSDQA